MGFRINTNIDALSAHASATANNRALSSSLGRLNSGLRIQSAADDASGLAIADSLRSQASSLTQAISNGNDAIGIIQTADKAMDEQLKILDTIKAKSVQAAQDGQTAETRKAIQADISRLMEELDMIGNTTSFNGQKLLNGSFTNKEFQVGAYSNETVKASIGPTTSDKIGLTRFETGQRISAFNGNVGITFINADGVNNIKLADMNSVADMVDAINAVSDKTGVKATLNTQTVGTGAITAGETTSTFAINGVRIGKVEVLDNDGNGALRAAINKVKDQTGVEASVDHEGRLVLTNRSGRNGIVMSGGVAGLGGVISSNYGRLSLVKLGGADIVVEATGLGFSQGAAISEKTVSLRQMDGRIDAATADAMGFFADSTNAIDQTAGVTTLKGAMAMMNVAEAAQKALDQVRSDLGSVQKQLEATVNNITVTQVNVKSAESNIRDVDFAAESATFSKHNILAQSGTYAMSQANATAQNVMRLLQ